MERLIQKTTTSDQITRREFIISLSLLAGSLPWISLLNCDAMPDNVPPSDQLRIGIIGLGSRGSKLLLHLQTIPGVDIAAICDDYKPHLYEGKILTGGTSAYFDNYLDLLEQKDIDAVVVATPPHLHAQMSLDAMTAGKHVFCEKIMALSIDDCQNMVDVQKKSAMILQIGFQRMFDIRYIKALELIRGGKIGDITGLRAFWHRNDSWRRPVRQPAHEERINWRLYRPFSGGLAAELAAHQIQITNWFMNTPPTQVMGTGSINFWKDGRDIYDNISLIVRYPGDVMLSYNSMLSNKHYGAVEQIMGPKGTIELETGKLYPEEPKPSPGIYQFIHDIENKVFSTIPIGGPSWVPDSSGKDKGEYIVDEIRIPSATQLELEAFVNSVKLREQIPQLLEQAFHASIVVLLGNQAMEKQQITMWPEGLAF